jgi:hypothetical protein
MFFSLLAALAVFQASPPDLPAGLTQDFVSTTHTVEQQLQAGDFAAATEKAKLLPKHDLVIGWDTAGVPDYRLPELVKARDLAITQWADGLHVHITVGANPDIKFAFADILDPETNEAIPAGATYQFSPDPSQPRLTVRLALHRINPTQDATPADIHNEVGYAISQYFGIERVPQFGAFNSRTDQTTTQQTLGTQFLFTLATSVLEASDQLRTFAQQQQKITLADPKIEVDTASISGLSGSQGKPLTFSFHIKNNGSANLHLIVVPDCGCLAPRGQPLIKPGESSTVEANVDTADYTGHQSHHLILLSNDPEHPVLDIPVKLYVEPLYRFFRPGTSVVQMSKSGADADVYVVLAKSAELGVDSAITNGPKASVDFAPWTGVLPGDTESAGAQVSGYKFHIHVEPSSLPGRLPITLMAATDNEQFRLLTYTFNLQKGIAALPQQIYLGEIPARPKKLSFIVSKPELDFQITSIESESPFVSATWVPLRGHWEYRVDVEYNGKADPGELRTQLKVHTNDPAQPILVVPFRALIK